MEDLQGIYAAIVVIAGAMSVLGGALGSFATIKSFLKNSILNAIDNDIDEKINKAKKETEELTKEDLEKLSKSIEGVSNSISSLSKQITDIKGDLGRATKVEQKQIIASSRYTINEAYKVCMKQRWIDSYTLSSLEDIYTIYDALGGNHFILDHMEELRRLPNEKPKTQPRKKTSK